MKAPPVPQKDGPRINREIHAREVQLIDAEGQNRGVVDIIQAQQSADEAGLDLVEIVPAANPPVCKILDYGKFRFLEQILGVNASRVQFKQSLERAVHIHWRLLQSGDCCVSRWRGALQ